MLKWHLVMAIACLAVLVSTALATEVDETTGPFHISFNMPADEVEVSVPDPFPGSSLTLYGLEASSPDWFLNLVITSYDEPHEIDYAMDRRGVSAYTGKEDSEAEEMAINGNYAISNMKTGPNGTSFDSIFWLDESSGYGTKKAELSIASGRGLTSDNEEFQRVFNSIIDTLKISY